MSSKPMPPRIRKRGICASRIKLEKAMAEAGCKTQAALAERIAAIENLDTAPKDFVSKVFREQSVDPSSIERIAVALGVESYKLYQTQDELNLSKGLPAQSSLTTPSTDRPSNDGLSSRYLAQKKGFLIILMLLAVLAIGWFLTADNKPAGKPDFLTIKPILGKHSIVLVSHADTNADAQISILTRLLAQNFTVNSPRLTADISLDNLAGLAERYQADLVLRLDKRIEGNFIVLDAYLYNQQQPQRIWSTSVRMFEFIKTAEQVWQSLSDRLNVLLGVTHNVSADWQTLPDLIARDYYIEGRNLLDRSQAELSFKSAQSRFYNAINIAPNFAVAHAGLCEALVLESWMGNEKILLEQAQRACDRALQLDSNSVYNKAALAHLYRRSGRVTEALTMLHQQYQLHPNNVDVLVNLAHLYLEANKLDLDVSDALAEAKNMAIKATEIAPSFWKSYQVLGLVELNAGNVQASIDAFTQAVSIDANELMLTNLGTLNFCRDNLEQALSNYQQAEQFSPQSHLSSEMIGMIKYFQGDFEQSLALRQKAAKLAGEAGIHQIWGAIADTYSQLQQNTLAIQHYSHALEIISKDSLRGNINASDQAYELYYIARISNLEAQGKPLTAALAGRLSQLEDKLSILDSAAVIRLALIEQMQNNHEKAAKLLNRAADMCPVYKKLPEFSQQVSNSLYTYKGNTDY